MVLAEIRMLVELAAVGGVLAATQETPLFVESCQVAMFCQLPEATLLNELADGSTTYSVAPGDVCEDPSQATLTVQRYFFPPSAKVVVGVV